MNWIKIKEASETIPQTHNAWLDYVLGLVIPSAAVIICLSLKWIIAWLKNKVKKEESKTLKKVCDNGVKFHYKGDKCKKLDLEVK